MKNTIKSWGRKLANTFVRKGTNRRIHITTGKQFDSVNKATVFVAFTNDGELNIQVLRHLDDSGEKKWEQLLRTNLNTAVEEDMAYALTHHCSDDFDQNSEEADENDEKLKAWKVEGGE